MFSHELNSSQRHALASLLSRVQLADGQAQESENELLAAYASALGVPEGATGALTTAIDLSALFSSQRAARIVILELVTLAYVDDDYCVAERELIESIGQTINVNVETVRRIETLVEYGRMWRKQCDSLLAE